MPPQVHRITPYLAPKPSGGTRRMAILSERDAETWQDLADRVALDLEPRLHPSVLANRSIVGRELVRPVSLGPVLRGARRAAANLSERHPVLIKTDVRSFYPSVSPSVLFESLRDLGVDRDVAGTAAGMLDGWGSEGYAGLPIGPPGSAVLANAVLAGVDAELERWPFLRWVDDYVIGLSGEAAVPQVLDRLDESLERRGLTRSESKTSILGGGGGLVWPGTYGHPDESE